MKVEIHLKKHEKVNKFEHKMDFPEMTEIE